MLEINTKAPSFKLPDENGQVHTLADYKGKWLVIYFYPKDDTPGCTKEACVIGEVYGEFAKLEVSVLGVSKDTSSSHLAFKEKYKLPFTLLSDESTRTIARYGAWQERSLYGRKFMGTARVTYIIDPKGRVAKVYSRVSPATHALQLLKDLRTLLAA
jgi:peroxiredoxin Q/BCP